jgi:hypothetical protein
MHICNHFYTKSSVILNILLSTFLLPHRNTCLQFQLPGALIFWNYNILFIDEFYVHARSIRSRSNLQCDITDIYSDPSTTPDWGLLSLHWSDIDPLNLGGSECTICFNILKLCILPTECICVFRVVLTINSDFCDREVMCFLWGTNWIYIQYLQEIRLLKG